MRSWTRPGALKRCSVAGWLSRRLTQVRRRSSGHSQTLSVGTMHVLGSAGVSGLRRRRPRAQPLRSADDQRNLDQARRRSAVLDRRHRERRHHPSDRLQRGYRLPLTRECGGERDGYYRQRGRGAEHNVGARMPPWMVGGPGAVAISSSGTQSIDARGLDVIARVLAGRCKRDRVSTGEQTIHTRGSLAAAPGVGLRVASLRRRGCEDRNASESGHQRRRQSAPAGPPGSGPPGPGNSTAGNCTAGRIAAFWRRRLRQTRTRRLPQARSTFQVQPGGLAGIEARRRRHADDRDDPRVASPSSAGARPRRSQRSIRSIRRSTPPVRSCCRAAQDATRTRSSASTGPQSITSRTGSVTLQGGTATGFGRTIETTSPFQTVVGANGSGPILLEGTGGSSGLAARGRQQQRAAAPPRLPSTPFPTSSYRSKIARRRRSKTPSSITKTKAT